MQEFDFTVPVPLEQAWDGLLDLEHVVACLPGAVVDSVDGNAVTGKFKVRVGRVQVTLQGGGRIVERDAQTHRAVLEASGTEPRGHGSASITIAAHLTPVGDETRVELGIDLTNTGRLADADGAARGQAGARIASRFVAAVADHLRVDPAVATAISAEVVAPELAETPASDEIGATRSSTWSRTGESAFAGGPQGIRQPRLVPEGAEFGVPQSQHNFRDPRGEWSVPGDIATDAPESSAPEEAGSVATETGSTSKAPSSPQPVTPPSGLPPRAKSEQALDLLFVLRTAFGRRARIAAAGVASVVIAVLWWRSRRR